MSARVGPVWRTQYETPEDVRYLPAGDNGILRLILYGVWKMRCHWCETVVQFKESQIDHLLPEKLANKPELQQLIQVHGLPADFTVHDPHNLALACGPCNRVKGGRVFTNGLMTNCLARASEKKPEVIRRVLAFNANNEIAQLVAALTAALHRSDGPAAFVEHAAVLVQKLAEIDEEAADFIVKRTADIRFGEHLVPAVLSLDGRGRALHLMASELCSSSWDDLLANGLPQVIAELVQHGMDLVAETFSDSDEMSSSSVDWLRMTASPSGFARLADMLVIDYAGLIYGDFAASGVANNIWGDGDPAVVDVSAEAYVGARFKLSACWNLTAVIPPSFTHEVAWMTDVNRSRSQ